MMPRRTGLTVVSKASISNAPHMGANLTLD
nr:hypothetical protein CPGR_04823 [Mycolicibacterium malmesburyense]